MVKGILITGATGFLGKALVKELMKDTDVILHPLLRSESSERVLKEELTWIDPDRIHPIRGDIERRLLGLDEWQLRHLGKSINGVWHLAASTSFEEFKRKEIQDINQGGTRNMIEALGYFKKLEKFFYMSTAYVCGKDKGVIPEAELTFEGRGFKNPYEESKLLCEKEVRQSHLPFTIIRPSIIVGDSRTGEAKGETRMVYGYLRGVYLAALCEIRKDLRVRRKETTPESLFWNRWLAATAQEDFLNVPVRLNADGNSTKNVVTIDDVVRVSAAIREAKDIVGKTYNLINPHNVTVGQLIDNMQHYLRVRGFQYVPMLTQAQIEKGNLAESQAFKKTEPYWPYVHDMEPTWKEDNVHALGVERVVMTPEKLSFLFERYVMNEIMPRGN